MRGVVSLATALSIPLYLTDGVAFPQRNLILFITFGVILVTLVFQGLTLPFILRIIHLEEIDAVVPAEIQRAGIQKHLNQIALAELKGIEGNDWLNIYKAKLEREEQPQPLSVKKREEFHAVLLKIYSLQRKELFKLRRENAFSDEEIRRAELQLDLDEMSITGAEH
jgi:NhaP-type Na+/H+ or K+/H+ antiporter